MPTRRLFVNWFLRASCYVLILACGLFSVARAQQPQELQVGISYVLTLAFSLVGVLLAAIIAIWSKNQDRRIETAQATADDAMKQSRHTHELVLNRYRPADDHEKAIDRAVRPLAEDIAEIKKDLKHVERMISRGSSQSGPHLVLPAEG